jgi:hypothetical protein
MHAPASYLLYAYAKGPKLHIYYARRIGISGFIWKDDGAALRDKPGQKGASVFEKYAYSRTECTERVKSGFMGKNQHDFALGKTLEVSTIFFHFDSAN